MLIRDLLPGEEDAVSRVYALSWKAGYQGIVQQDYLDALPLNNWTQTLADSALHSLVLTVDDKPVATAAISPARDGKLPSWGEIVSCYVLPEYWNQGYGGVLLKMAVKTLRESGFQNIYLWVLEQNTRARTFYEKNGFQWSGETATLEIGGRELREVRYVLHTTAPEREENGT